MVLSLPERILQALNSTDFLNSFALAKEWNVDHQKIVGAVKSLECLDGYVVTSPSTVRKIELTPEGLEVARNGSHEFLVYSAIPKNSQGIAQTEIQTLLGQSLSSAVLKVGFSKAISSGLIILDKSDGSGKPLVKRKEADAVDVVRQNLNSADLTSLNEKLINEYRKRKLLTEVVIKSYDLRKGPNFSLTVTKAETELTPEMIATGAWKNIEFKPYNFDAMGIQPPSGYLHPLLKVRAEYRQIFLEMGFEEMPTNNFIESSFWNFDALFQPQQHPARDAHDTFFISDPAEAMSFPKEYLDKVKKVHSEGGFGSEGYGYDWSIKEAKKNLLRTHTTAVSARMLYKLANEGKFQPKKYFSIDRVFRNETLDATHLAEFHQIEGVIADYGLTLGDLIGVLYEFFNKLGIQKLRFKPAYNPYTEPSMEIFSYHEGLKKWVEIGNSGVFRPEMLLPMGLPEDVVVIAWGLSLERPTMIKYGIDNIRDLCGHKINLKMVEKSPICRLDKDSHINPLLRITERRWESIFEKVEQLRQRLSPYNRDVSNDRYTVNESMVIHADPRFPPYSVLVLLNSLSENYGQLKCTVHVHSDQISKVSNPLLHFFEDLPIRNNHGLRSSSLSVSLIWKPVGTDPILSLHPAKSIRIRGESNILRYLLRLSKDTKLYNEMTDSYLDTIHTELIHKSPIDLKRIPSMPNDFVANLFLWSVSTQRKLDIKSIQSRMILTRDPFTVKVMNTYSNGFI